MPLRPVCKSLTRRELMYVTYPLSQSRPTVMWRLLQTEPSCPVTKRTSAGGSARRRGTASSLISQILDSLTSRAQAGGDHCSIAIGRPVALDQTRSRLATHVLCSKRLAFALFKMPIVGCRAGGGVSAQCQGGSAASVSYSATPATHVCISWSRK